MKPAKYLTLPRKKVEEALAKPEIQALIGTEEPPMLKDEEILVNTILDTKKQECQALLTQLEREVEGMRKVGIREYERIEEYEQGYARAVYCKECGGYDECDCEGYNTALDDVINLIKKYRSNHEEK